MWNEILKKFGFLVVKTSSTPMETQKPLLKDEDGEEVDVHLYRSMIGSLMYLTSSRDNIMFVVCACARYQVNPKVSHLHAVKRFFRYLKGQPKLDLIGVNVDDSKIMLLGINLLLLGKVNAARHNLQLLVNLQALVDGKKIIITEASIRRDLQEGTDCLTNATIFEELTRMRYEKLSQKLTFYKAFFSPQWKFLSHTILQCLSAKTTSWNEFSSLRLLFVQVFLEKQLEGMSSHKRIYVTPSHTKKIFGNMKRVGKGFSGRETPLFPIMVVQDQAEMGEGSVIQTDPHHTRTIIQPSTSQPQKKQRSRKPKRKDNE
ncbi:hypothetical protein Tco_0669759, partial [Tanacetum coccineum]